MTYLLDTNVISELRKRERCNPQVRAWFEAQSDEALFTSALVIGEIRKVIENIRRRNPEAAAALDRWLHRVTTRFSERILPIDQKIAENWGRLAAGRTIPVVDGLLAATARHHDLTLVTRNVGDIAHLEVRWLNPFEPAG